MKEKSIKKNLFYNTILIIGTTVFPLITFPYVSRILNPDGLGMANYANSIVSYLTLISCLGVNAYGLKEGVKYRDDEKKLGKFVSEMLIINIAAALIASIIFVVLFLLPWHEKYRHLLLIYGVLIYVTPLTMSWFISLMEEYRYVTIRTLIVQTASMISIFMFIKSTGDYEKYAAIIILTNVLTMLLNIAFAKKHIIFFGYKNYEIKKHLKPIMMIFGSSVAATIYVNSDVTILGIMSGNYNVGIYSAAVRIIRIVISYTSALSTVILPRVSYYQKKGMEDQYLRLVKKGLDFLLMVSIPAAVGLIFVSQPAVRMILGAKYMDAISTLKILAPDILLSPLSGYISYQIVLPHNKEKVFMISTMVSCLVNIGLNILLIPLFSENAAAFTTLLSEALNILICVIFTRKEIRYVELFKNAKNYLTGAGIMGLTLLIVTFLISSSYVTLFLSIAIGAFVYFFYLMIVKDEMILYAKDQFVSKLYRRR